MIKTLNPMEELSQNLKSYTTAKNYLCVNITTATEFSKTLLYLSPTQKVNLYGLFKSRFDSIVQDNKDFETLIDCLEEYIFPQFNDPLQAQRGIAKLCCSLKERLPSLIKSSKVICQLLGYLSAEKFSAERLLVCESLKKENSFICNASDLKGVLARLQPAEQILLFESLQTRWDSILKNPEDFNQIISSLAADECMVLCQSLTTYWPSLIKNPKDYSLLVSFLKDHGHTAALAPLFESLQTHWPLIIKTTGDLVGLLAYLTPIERQEVCESFVNDWPSSLIKNINDLQQVSHCFDVSQFEILCETLKRCSPTLIEDQPKNDLAIFTSNVDIQKVKILFTCFKKDTPLMEKNADQVSEIDHASSSKSGTSFSRCLSKFFSKKLPLILKNNLSPCLTLRS